MIKYRCNDIGFYICHLWDQNQRFWNTNVTYYQLYLAPTWSLKVNTLRHSRGEAPQLKALITSEYWSLVSRPGVFIGFYKIAGQVRGQWIDWWMVSSRGGSVTYAKYSWKRVGEDVSCWPMWLFFVHLFDVQAPFNLQSATAEIFQWWPVSRGTLGVNSLPSLYLPRCSTATPSPPLASRVRGQPQPM